MFQSGTGLGLFFAFLLGGIVIQLFGWRAAFISAGVAGLILALIMLVWLTEARSDTQPETATTPPRAAIPFGTLAAQLFENRISRHLLVGSTLASLVTYGGVSWFPSYMVRVHGMELA